MCKCFFWNRTYGTLHMNIYRRREEEILKHIYIYIYTHTPSNNCKESANASSQLHGQLPEFRSPQKDPNKPGKNAHQTGRLAPSCFVHSHIDPCSTGQLQGAKSTSLARGESRSRKRAPELPEMFRPGGKASSVWIVNEMHAGIAFPFHSIEWMGEGNELNDR